MENMAPQTVVEPSIWKMIKKELRHDSWALVSLCFIGCSLLFAYIAPLFIPASRYERVDFFKIFEAPSSENLLGTDYGGRDIFSLLVVGTRNSFTIAFLITVFIFVIGVLLGVIAGFYKGWIDMMIMRMADFVASLPSLMFFIVFASLVPKFSILYFVIIIVIFCWVGVLRVIRAKALAECEQEYIKASKTFGTPTWKILLVQLFPNLSSILIVAFTLNLAGNIGIESTLSFIGFGLPESTPSLGTLISYARNPDVISSRWWVWFPASSMILLMMLSINFIGQALKRMADARQRTI